MHLYDCAKGKTWRTTSCVEGIELIYDGVSQHGTTFVSLTCQLYDINFVIIL